MIASRVVVRVALLSALSALSLVPSLARAQTRERVALSYLVGAGVTRCPDERALREAVAARLGRDPFSDEPSTASRVSVTVVRAGRGLHALVAWNRPDGALVGTREVSSQGGDCNDIVSTVALAVSVALDASRTSAPPTHPEPPPPVAPPPAPPVAPLRAVDAPSPRGSVATSAPEVPRASVRGWVSLGPRASLGFSPGGDLGLTLEGGVSLGRFALSIGVSADLFVSITRQPEGGATRTQRVAAELAACWHAGEDTTAEGLVCALGVVGRLSGEGLGVDAPRLDTVWPVDVGARGALEVRASRRVAVRLRIDVTSPVVRTAVTLDGRAVWEASWVQATAGLAIVWRFV